MNNWKKIIWAIVFLWLSFNLAFATWNIDNPLNSTWALDSSWTVLSTSTDLKQDNSWILKIDTIDFLDNKTLSIKLSNQLEWISTWSEVKILQDLKVESSVKDADNSKKVKVTLQNPMVEWSSYSLVSVSEWIDTSIDFTLWKEKSKILNTEFDKNNISIEYISILDDKNIEVNFNKEIKSTSIDFKMFNELKVESLFLDTTNLNIKLVDNLVSNNAYIAILTLKDMTQKDIEVANSLYDFNTPEFSEVKIESNTWSSLSTSWATSWSWVESVAMEAKRTPDTWTKTNALILIALLLWLGILFFNKKNLKY